jgi:hypothetical protein
MTAAVDITPIENLPRFINRKVLAQGQPVFDNDQAWWKRQAAGRLSSGSREGLGH